MGESMETCGQAMRVLVACEFSGIVRDAFAKHGHDSWSCDLLPCERGGQHIQGDVMDHLHDDWDLMVAHPPCTYLASSGARWFKGRRVEQRAAIRFVSDLWYQAAKLHHNLWYQGPYHIAIENPIGVLSTQWRKPDQIIQPWQFGHGETKATCLWLKNLPPLSPTQIVDGRSARVHCESPGPERWKNRSRTFHGIADAMAEQWGGSPEYF